jgi:hypothetical protein
LDRTAHPTTLVPRERESSRQPRYPRRPSQGRAPFAQA